MVVPDRPRMKRDLNVAAQIATLLSLLVAICFGVAGVYLATLQLHQSSAPSKNFLSRHLYFSAKNAYNRGKYDECVRLLEDIRDPSVKDDKELFWKINVLEVDARSNMLASTITASRVLDRNEAIKLKGLIEFLIGNPSNIPQDLPRQEILAHYQETLRLLKVKLNDPSSLK